MELMIPIKGVELDLSKVSYPIFGGPKYDGIRCNIQQARALTYKLLDIPNQHIRNTLSRPEFDGLDGELIVGDVTAEDVYLKTNSGVMSRDGTPDFRFIVFDIMSPVFSYIERYHELVKRVGTHGVPLQLHRHTLLENEQQLLEFEADCLRQGYEGIVLRTPLGLYKFGRSTMREQYLLKRKPFRDGEAVILSVYEQMHNGNAAQKNEHGRTKRSSSKKGKTGKDTLGGFEARCLTTGAEFRCGGGPGFTDATRAHLWSIRDSLPGEYFTFKFLPIGVKEAPRHPQFLRLRDKRDM